jgi:chromosome segregation ATPase
MVDTLLPVILLVGIATLAVAAGALRSSRRSENLGENHFELLRDQHERLELLREERRMLIAELERETSERRRFMESLRRADPQLTEDLVREHEEDLKNVQRRAELQEQERARLEEELERERREHQEILRRAEELEREKEQSSGLQQEAERLRQEHQRLAEDLERGREERVEVQRRAERQEHELARLEQELRQSQAELERRKRAPARAVSGANRPWWRSPILVVGLFLGVLIAWFTSLVVALNVLAS